MIWCQAASAPAARPAERGDALRALLDAAERWVRATTVIEVSNAAADDVKNVAFDYARACGWTPPHDAPDDGV